MIDRTTAFLGLPLPNEQNELQEDCQRIVQSFNKIDSAIADIRPGVTRHEELLTSHADKLAKTELRLIAAETRVSDVQTRITGAEALAQTAKTSADNIFNLFKDMGSGSQISYVSIPMTPIHDGDYVTALDNTSFEASSMAFLQNAVVSHFLLTIPALEIEKRRFNAANGKATITFRVPQNMPDDTELAITLTAVDSAGNVSKDFKATVRTYSKFIWPPSVTSPANGATGILTRINVGITFGKQLEHFKPNSTGLQTQIAKDAGFTQILFDDLCNGSNQITSNLCPMLESETAYFVRARCVHQTYGNSDWSEVASFTTGIMLHKPSITEPLVGAINVAQKARITVHKGTDGLATIQKYQIQFARDADFTNIVADMTSALLSSPASYSATLTESLPPFTLIRCRARSINDTYGIGGWSDIISFTTGNSAICGVAQETTGSGGRTLKRIDINSKAVSENPDFITHPIYKNISLQTIDGQEMIRIPKFFFRRGIAAGGISCLDAWSISDVAYPGFDVHPAFLAKDGQTALDQVWVGKYQASTDSANSSKAASKPDVSPLVSIDFPTMQNRCKARNTGGVDGFHLWNIHEWAAIGLLMLIEYAGTDFQTLIGRGRVDASGRTTVSAADVAQATWRGIVGLWGNIWQMCDGLQGEGGTWRVDMGKGYVDTGITNPNAGFWPNVMRKGKGSNWNIDHLFIADSSNQASSDSSATFPDYQYQYYSSPYVTYVGGDCVNGSNAGPFHLICSYNPSSSDSNLGGRLAKW